MLRRKNLLAMSDLYRATHQLGAKDRWLFGAAVEPLEGRLHLSGTQPLPPVMSHPRLIPVTLQYPLGSIGTASGAEGTPGPAQPFTGVATPSLVGGLTPAQVRGAYGLGQYGSSNITFGSIQGDGTGQTIAIVDSFNDPGIVTDLHTFDAAESLPNPPSFTVLNQNGAASPLPANSTLSDDWAGEESLDVEWAHVMAPGAKIILFECNSDEGADLYQGDITAAATADVSAVSNSWGGAEYSGENNDDSDFTTPANHSGVSFFFSAGDYLGDSLFPAESPNVVAVGGTQLTVSGNSWSSETVWDDEIQYEGTSGGPSAYEPQPGFQAGTVTASFREVPDLSLAGGQNNASSNSYVPVCDSFDDGASTPWVGEEGTSWSCPMMAGLETVANQGRVAEGLTPLTGAQTLTRLYQLPKTNFHDITTGSNGYAATVGYDEASGIGTPIANLLIADLAGTRTITGRAFIDDLGNGIYGGNDVPLGGKTVYLDLNNDGVLDNGEPSTTTDSLGSYTFPQDQPAGGTVRLTSPAPAGYFAEPVVAAAIGYGSTNTVNFTYFPTSFATTATATNYTLQSDSTGIYDQILINNTLSYGITKSALGSTALPFSLTGTGDSFTIDATYGNPILSGGVTLTGASGGDPVLINGTQTLNDSYIVTNSGVTFDGTPFTFSNVSLLTLNPGNAAASLEVDSGSASIQAPRLGGGILARRFSSINVASGAKLLFPSGPDSSDRAVVATSAISDSGQIDLGANDMIVYGGTVAALFPLLESGYNHGTWTGQGIDSAAAMGNTTHLTALGVLSNNAGNGTAIYNSFDYVAVSASAILVKYTYYGDANLDGQVDGSDYSKVDSGFLTHLTGWSNGDFNYDNSVNGTDYTLIDNAYNRQGASLATQIAAEQSSENKVDVHTQTGSFCNDTFSTATLNFLGSSNAASMESWLKRKDVLDSLAIAD